MAMDARACPPLGFSEVHCAHEAPLAVLETRIQVLAVPLLELSGRAS